MSNDNDNDNANVPAMRKALLAISEVAKRDMATYACNYAASVGESRTIKAWSNLIADFCDMALEPIPAAQPDTACVAQEKPKIEQPTQPIAQKTAKTEQSDGIAAALNKAGNICLFVEENCGDEQTAQYMSEAIAVINKAVAPFNTTGNAAALRAALEEQLRYWNARVRTRDEEEMRKRTEAALAKPVRNCDRFDDEQDAQLAFLNEVWLISVDRETMIERDKYENWTDEMRKRYGRWLLASTTEQKGDNNGR